MRACPRRDTSGAEFLIEVKVLVVNARIGCLRHSSAVGEANVGEAQRQVCGVKLVLAQTMEEEW